MHITLSYFDAPLSHVEWLSKRPVRCLFCGRRKRGLQFTGHTFVPGHSEESTRNRHGCLQCLSNKRFWFVHDTELGVLNEGKFESYGDGNSRGRWYLRTRRRPPRQTFSKEAIRQLPLTPQFKTQQGARWLAHCNDFMTYTGRWTFRDFQRRAPDGNGQTLFEAMTNNGPDFWKRCVELAREYGVEFNLSGAWYYVFRCRHCGILRGYYDLG